MNLSPTPDCKALLLTFHGFAAYNGISKKIFYQRDALARCGTDIRLCYLTVDPDGHRRRMVDNTVQQDFGTGVRAKIAKRICYGSLTRYIREQGIRFVYMRSDHNANPFLIRFLKRLRKTGVKIAMEIPTYPYDQEYVSLRFRMRLLVDRIFRRRMARQIDRIVTFSDSSEIFGRPTIRISNGIDFSQIPVKKQLNDTSRELNLIGVAEIHFWHGFDRVIAGLADYYGKNRAEGKTADTVPYRVNFHIVGSGTTPYDQLVEMTERYGLQQYVTFHGTQSGEGLDALFEQADMGIASLGRHRSGIDRIKTLKNREYAARGIPFVYSETDDDFDAMPYVMKVPADESPLDIEALLRFADSVNRTPAAIRGSIENTLSWDVQMQQVLDQIEPCK